MAELFREIGTGVYDGHPTPLNYCKWAKLSRGEVDVEESAHRRYEWRESPRCARGSPPAWYSPTPEALSLLVSHRGYNDGALSLHGSFGTSYCSKETVEVVTTRKKSLLLSERSIVCNKQTDAQNPDRSVTVCVKKRTRASRDR